jgi:hypothetical protein
MAKRKATAAQLRNLAKGRKKLAAMRSLKKRHVVRRKKNPESGREGNLPKWRGASAAYSKAYATMAKYGPDAGLIKALNEGDEEKIKGILLEYSSRDYHGIEHPTERFTRTGRPARRKTKKKTVRKRNPAYGNYQAARAVARGSRRVNPVRPPGLERWFPAPAMFFIMRGARYFTGYSFSKQKRLAVHYTSVGAAKAAAQKLADKTGTAVRVVDARK